MRLKTSFVLLLLVGLSVPLHAFASADRDSTFDDYEWKTWRTRRSHAGFNGHGAFFFEAQTFQSKDLDNLAIAMGVDKFNDVMLGWGGYGLGHIGNGWRIGGGGFGMEAKTSGIYVDPGSGEKYNQQLLMSMGGGGFIVEYSPWMIGPVNFGVGGLIGGGGVQIEMRRDSGTFTWSDLTGQYTNPIAPAENTVTMIEQDFFLFEPYATVRVHVLDWMAVEGTAGYHVSTLSANGWTFGSQEVSANSPDLDLMRPFFRVGLAFGG